MTRSFRMLDGTVRQSADQWDVASYTDQRLWFPVLGVVINVRHSDEYGNRTNLQNSAQRGSAVEADVLVINDGMVTSWPVPHVVVLPAGASGVDHYHEELPRPCTRSNDNTPFDGRIANKDIRNLDGDLCIVQFIGGRIDQPVMTSWYPHPGNFTDPSTIGAADTLIQGRRFFKRFAGAKFAIGADGSVLIDTNESGDLFEGSSNGFIRTKRDGGGNVQIDVKEKAQLEVNFNTPVPLPSTAPSWPQPNPGTRIEETREDTLSRLTMDKDFINAVAGRVVQLMGNNDGTDNADTVLLGETPTDHVIKGETHQATYNELVSRLNAFEEAYENHIHATANGNSTVPIDPSTPELSYQNLCYPLTGIEPQFGACTAAGLHSTTGGTPYITNETDAAAHNGIWPTPVTVPPPAPGVERADPMPDDDLSDVVKTE